MHDRPFISVIMPVYNAATFLKKAIDSILLQTYPNFELIIINDCSTDASEAEINSFKDPRINYISLAQNAGVVNAMNIGLKQSKGKYIAVMHADDISLPHRFETQVQVLEDNTQTAVVAGLSKFVNDYEEPTGEVWEADEKTITPEAIRKTMIKANCISHPTVMMRSEVVKKYGYSSSAQHQGFAVEDYPLWLNILSDGYTIEKVPDAVLLYRVHKSSATGVFLKKSNPFLIHYTSKKFYLDQKKKQGPLNEFDRQVCRSMQRDFIKAKMKDLKNRIKPR